MDARSEESLRQEIQAIEAIPYPNRTIDDKKRLNDLEDEIKRRHPELHRPVSQGKKLENWLID